MGGPGEGVSDPWSLIDVTRLPFDRLVADTDTVLAHSLRRLLGEFERAQEVLSAFDNYAGDPPDFPPDLPGERPAVR